MAKRGADKDLTQDNWDVEDEEEEAGHFKVASEEDLSKRRIIKAKRRVKSSESKGLAGKVKSCRSTTVALKPPQEKGSGVFQGFSGFSGLSNNSKSSLPVMLSKMKPLTGFTNQTSGVKFSSTETSTSTLSQADRADKNGATNSGDSKGQITSDYNDNIKALNESVAAWIEKHIRLNPYVDLTPIFNDYKDHMKNIDLKFSASASGLVSSSSPSLFDEKNSAKQPTSPPVSTASFGKDSTQLPCSSFSSSCTQGSEEKAEEELNTGSSVRVEDSEPGTSCDAEEQPPKPEQVVTAEEGAFHSSRCKLFFKRESSWTELGLGMLSLKKLDGKTQVLVRNDTTLGKILLNVFLFQSTPISRSGKNNVILVSVPNPPLYSKASEGDNSKPATYLIRVKTTENADELYTQMDSNRSASV